MVRVMDITNRYPATPTPNSQPRHFRTYTNATTLIRRLATFYAFYFFLHLTLNTDKSFHSIAQSLRSSTKLQLRICAIPARHLHSKCPAVCATFPCQTAVRQHTFPRSERNPTHQCLEIVPARLPEVSYLSASLHLGQDARWSTFRVLEASGDHYTDTCDWYAGM